jgi:isopenicillin N synthase-like dioxygenase
MDYATHLSRIATTLFEAMAKNLELNLKSTKSYVSENTGLVRVYRYPCTDVGWGMEVHTDSSVLSILNQDDHVSGLQVLKDDQWLTVKPISNTLIVNLGDMMQVLIFSFHYSIILIYYYLQSFLLKYFVFILLNN